MLLSTKSIVIGYIIKTESHAQIPVSTMRKRVRRNTILRPSPGNGLNHIPSHFIDRKFVTNFSQKIFGFGLEFH